MMAYSDSQLLLRSVITNQTGVSNGQVFPKTLNFCAVTVTQKLLQTWYAFTAYFHTGTALT